MAKKSKTALSASADVEDAGEDAEASRLAAERAFLADAFLPAYDRHVDCGGHRAVVGFDGGLRAAPLDAEELVQRQQDHAEHQKHSRPLTPEEKLDRLLASVGMTRDELKQIL